MPDYLRPLLISPIWVQEKKRKWGELAARFVDGRVCIKELEPGDRDDLLAQAGQIKYITESNGKIRIETRRDRIARQKRSPEAWAHTKGRRSHAIDRRAGRRIPPAE